MSLMPPRLVRILAVPVVLSMAAGVPAAEVPETAPMRDRDAKVAASSAGVRTPDGVPGETGAPQDTERHGAPFVHDLQPLTRVRIVTLPPSDVRGAVVEEDSRSVLLEEAPSGRRLALSIPQRSDQAASSAASPAAQRRDQSRNGPARLVPGT